MIKHLTAVTLSFAAMGALSAPAQAALMQPSDYVTVPVEYTGTITSSPAENIMLVLPGGQTVAYTGPEPD